MPGSHAAVNKISGAGLPCAKARSRRRRRTNTREFALDQARNHTRRQDPLTTPSRVEQLPTSTAASIQNVVKRFPGRRAKPPICSGTVPFIRSVSGAQIGTICRVAIFWRMRGEVRQPETNAVGKARQPGVGGVHDRSASASGWRDLTGALAPRSGGDVRSSSGSRTLLFNCLFDRSNASRSCHRPGAKMGSHPAKSRQESGGVWTVICPGKQHFANLLDSSRPARGLLHTEEVTGSIPVSPTDVRPGQRLH